MEPSVPGNVDPADAEICNYSGALVIILIGTIAAIAVLVLIYAGGQYIIGGANEAQRSDAKDRIWGAILGLIIALSSWLLLNTLDASFVKGCYTISPLQSPKTAILSTANERPTITVIPGTIVYQVGYNLTEQDIMTGVTSSDPEDGSITIDIKAFGDNITTQTPGEYVVNYYVEDSVGNVAEGSRVILIESIPPPTDSQTVDPTIVPETNQLPAIILNIGETYALADLLSGITDYDLTGIDITSIIEIVENNILIDTPGIYQVVFNIIDGEDIIQITRTVEVVDDAPPITPIPVITLNPSVITFQVGEAFTDADLMVGVTATDSIGTDITSSIMILQNTLTTDTAGEYQILYYVEDGSGGSTEASRTAEVLEEQLCLSDSLLLENHKESCPSGYPESDGWTCLSVDHPTTDYVMEIRFNLTNTCIKRSVVWMPGGVGDAHVRVVVPGTDGIEDALATQDIRSIEFSYSNPEGIFANSLDLGTYLDGAPKKSAVLAYFVDFVASLGLDGDTKMDIQAGSFGTIATTYALAFHNMDPYINRAVLALGPMGFNFAQELNNPSFPSYVGGTPLNILSGEILGGTTIRQLIAIINGWSETEASPYCDYTGPCPEVDKFSLLITNVVGTSYAAPGASLNLDTEIYSLLGGDDLPWFIASSMYLDSVIQSPYTPIIIPGADHQYQSLEMDAKILELLSY